MGVYTEESRSLGHPGLRCSTQTGLYTLRNLAPATELKVLRIRTLANKDLDRLTSFLQHFPVKLLHGLFCGWDRAGRIPLLHNLRNDLIQRCGV